MITLNEAVELLNDKTTENDPRLLEFMSEVDRVGTDILKDRDSDYLLAAVAMIQSVSIAVIAMETSDSAKGMVKALELVFDPNFSKVAAIAFKMSVGLAAIEELR